MMKNIGIIGATGQIGRILLEISMDLQNIKIIAGSRNIEKIKSKYSNSDKLEIVKVNVYNEKQLHSFVSKCDLVVNCSSPASELSVIIARICIEKKVDFIDLSGDMDLREYAINNKDVITKNKIRIVLSSGLHPGFTEIFPKFIAQKYKENIAIREFFCCCGEISKMAAKDFIHGIKENQGLGMRMYSHGITKKLENIQLDYIDKLKHEKMLKETYPSISFEMIEMSNKEKNLDTFEFYTAFPNKNIFNVLMDIRIKTILGREINEDMSADMLLNAYREMTQYYGKTLMIKIFVSNSNDTKDYIDFIFSGENEVVSATVAYCVIDSLLKNRINDYGVFYSFEVVNCEKVVNMLIQQGAYLQMNKNNKEIYKNE